MTTNASLPISIFYSGNCGTQQRRDIVGINITYLVAFHPPNYYAWSTAWDVDVLAMVCNNDEKAP